VALLSEQDRETIRRMFEGLVDPVRLVLFTLPTSGLFIPGRPQCETCDDAQHVLEEVAELSDKLSLEAHHLEREADEARRYGVERAPSLLVLGPDDGRVRYVGAPFGHEFALLLQDIQFISKGETKLSQETRDALSNIDDDIHLQVFVTPT
jgi:alkyl hydroperoxide reductase subunit AhpF